MHCVTKEVCVYVYAVSLWKKVTKEVIQLFRYFGEVDNSRRKSRAPICSEQLRPTAERIKRNSKVVLVKQPNSLVSDKVRYSISIESTPINRRRVPVTLKRNMCHARYSYSFRYFFNRKFEPYSGC